MKEGVIEKKILVHDYLDGICPNCQGSNLETFYEETGDGFHTEEVTCLECGAIVKAVYKLQSVQKMYTDPLTNNN